MKITVKIHEMIVKWYYYYVMHVTSGITSVAENSDVDITGPVSSIYRTARMSTAIQDTASGYSCIIAKSSKLAYVGLKKPIYYLPSNRDLEASCISVDLRLRCRAKCNSRAALGNCACRVSFSSEITDARSRFRGLVNGEWQFLQSVILYESTNVSIGRLCATGWVSFIQVAIFRTLVSFMSAIMVSAILVLPRFPV